MARPDAPAIRRVTDVPEDAQTSDRTEVAEYIETNILAEDRWPVTLTQIANETGFSRQHVRNVLEYYFEEASPRPEPSDISVPDDVETESYLRGYIAGMRDAQ